MFACYMKKKQRCSREADHCPEVRIALTGANKVNNKQFVQQINSMSHYIVQADNPLVRKNHRKLKEQGQADLWREA